jgi:hypothetical protein
LKSGDEKVHLVAVLREAGTHFLDVHPASSDRRPVEGEINDGGSFHSR